MPAPDLFVRRGASDFAYAQLRQLIVNGELRPGICVAEKDLAARMGLSRTPLRESIKTLESQGFMTRLPNGHLMVSPLKPRTLKDLFATRLAIERVIVESVVSEATEDEIEAVLGPIAAVIRISLRDGTLESAGIGERFHYALAEISPNKIASTILWQLRDRIVLYRKIGPEHSPGRRIRAAKDHIQIYELVRARRTTDAVRVMEEHILRSQEVALGFLTPSESPKVEFTGSIVDSAST